MPSRNTEFFIARRIAGGGSQQKRNVMLRIATLTVAVSVAVMLIAVSVIRGFRSEITDKLIGFGAHVQLVCLENNNSMETSPISRDAELEASLRAVPDFGSLEAFATKGGIITGEDAIQGIFLKGLDPGYDSTFFLNTLVEGSLPRIGADPRTKDIMISKRLSEMLELSVGDAAQMLFVQEGEQPRRDKFRVSGIYSTGYEEMDKIVVITDIRNVQRLNNWTHDMITGYELTTTRFDRLDDFVNDVYDTVISRPGENPEPLMGVSLKQRFVNIFDWLSAHNVNGIVIITIMLLVAFFNMVSALLIMVLERTSMIGTLKTMGMTNRSLQKIFIIRSAYIVLSGMLFGNILGIGLLMAQKYLHIVKLNQAGYFLSEVPVDLGWWIVALNAGCFVILTVSQMLPTMIVSRIKPEKSIRYQ